jgi:hypothetical protein
MTKICPKCLKLTSDLNACPDCGAVLSDIESWRSSRTATAMKTDVALPDVAWTESSTIPPPQQDRITQPLPLLEMINADVESNVSAQNQPIDWTKFVLGVLISSLVFFCTFLAAYVASGAAR